MGFYRKYIIRFMMHDNGEVFKFTHSDKKGKWLIINCIYISNIIWYWWANAVCISSFEWISNANNRFALQTTRLYCQQRLLFCGLHLSLTNKENRYWKKWNVSANNIKLFFDMLEIVGDRLVKVVTTFDGYRLVCNID